MPKGAFRFVINWPITLLSLVFLPLLIALGSWQYNKGIAKSRLQESWLSQQGLPALSVERLDPLRDIDYRRVRLEGRFDVSRYWLLENQVHDGQVGVNIIMPFRLPSGELLLVNRGWAGSDYEGSDALPDGPLSVTGTLKQPSDSVLINEADNTFRQWPHRLLEIDIEQMNSHYGNVFYPRVLLLDADSQAALQVHWQPLSLSPERHRGYALQWWLMALALVILWFFANISSRDSSTTITRTTNDRHS